MLSPFEQLNDIVYALAAQIGAGSVMCVGGMMSFRDILSVTLSVAMSPSALWFEIKTCCVWLLAVSTGCMDDDCCRL